MSSLNGLENFKYMLYAASVAEKNMYIHVCIKRVMKLIHMHMYTHTCTCIYMYMYMYVSSTLV